MYYDKGKQGYSVWDWKDIQIAKQAVLKSLIEANVVKGRDKESEKIADDWVSWIFRKSQAEYNILEGKDETSVQDFTKSLK